MKKTNLYISLIVLLSFGTLSCSYFPFLRSDAGNPEYYLPRETEVPGWKMPVHDEIEVTVKEKNEGIREKAKAGYMSYGSEDLRIDVTVYRCKTPLDAFGVISSEKFPFKASAERADNSELVTGRKGEYGFVIRSVGSSEVPETTLNEFGKVINDKILKFNKKRLPDYLKTFSRDSQEDYLDGLYYFKKGLPLVPGLKNVFIRSREIYDKKKYIFFIKYDSKGDAAGHFSNLFTLPDKSYILVQTGARHTVFLRNNRTFLFISTQRDWIFGVINADTISEGNSIVDQLKNEL